MAALLECPACGLRMPPGNATCPRDGSRLRLGPDLSALTTAPRDMPSAADTAPRDMPSAADTAPRDMLTAVDTAPRDILTAPGEAGPQGVPRPAGALLRNLLEGPAVPAWPRRRPPLPAESPTVPQDMLIGAQLGEYVVKERIGVGGMGLVYRAEQPLLRKPVAIKVLRPEVCDNPDYVQRLLAEARAVNAIRHRGIIDVFSFGQTPDGRQYFVMEFLDGITLDQHIAARGALTPREVTALSEEILAALAAAHEAGVVHRDLKPSNIFLVRQPGGAPYVKLLDFGLAKQKVTDLPTALTQAGRVIGTPEYMAPEQARSESATSRTDLYAFGVVAFEMLAGRLPFKSDSPMGYLARQLHDAPPSLLELRPGTPPALASLVMRLLAKRAEDRPSMAEVRQELRRLSRAALREAARTETATEVVVAPPPARLQVREADRETVDESPAEPPPPAPTVAPLPPRRSALLWAAAGAGAALVALGVALALLPSGGAEAEPPIASRALSEPPSPDPGRPPGPRSAPPPESAPVAAPAAERPPAKAVAPPGAERRSEKRDLLARIERLEQELAASSADEETRGSALAQLRDARSRLEGTLSSQDRQAVSERLDAWERLYLGQ